MQVTKLAKAVPFALALCVPGAAVLAAAPVSQAAVVQATMQVTKMGTFEKTVSSTAFKMAVGMKSYEVKTDSMTHVTLGGKSVKITSLKKGDTLSVKGELEMGTIVATSVVAGM